MTTTTRHNITISGNWSENGPENEWAGSGTVDQYGAVECAAELGDEAYDLIEQAIADGEDEGYVTVHSEDMDRDVTYHFEISDE